MKLYLIRHGESTGDIEGRFGGDYDDHLTQRGIAQAKELAEYLKDRGIEILFTSPKIRARETTNQITTILQIQSEVIENLRERNTYGVLTGLTKEEAEVKYPTELDKLLKDKKYHTVLGSESYEEITKRVTDVFENIFSKDYKVAAVISHGGIISTFVREVLTTGENMKIGDCAVLEVRKQGDKLEFDCLLNCELID